MVAVKKAVVSHKCRAAPGQGGIIPCPDSVVWGVDDCSVCEWWLPSPPEPEPVKPVKNLIRKEREW